MMYCDQCQEAAKGVACVRAGVCGKTPDVSNEQDVLVRELIDLAHMLKKAEQKGQRFEQAQAFLIEALFQTVTNTNFDQTVIQKSVQTARAFTKQAAKAASEPIGSIEHADVKDAKGPLLIEDDDARAVASLVLYGLKGMAAYVHHAMVLGKNADAIIDFMIEALSALADKNQSLDDLLSLTMKTGEFGVTAMALLDEANTQTYGNPRITQVNIGVRNNPAILVSGHDLKDLHMLLEQTKNTGVDVYTHGEMLPAHYYPVFSQHDHFVGNYGNSWWQQKQEFETFNGPILFTTNCIVPSKKEHMSRIYTTGAAGFPGCEHINADENGNKDFSVVIEQAKSLPAPEQIETGTIVGGFAHAQVFELADKVVEAVKSGAISKFVVMAGCDGRNKSRQYYTDFAKKLPEDTVILTAGCAKYRYNKLGLGDIGGIPRVLDAGQCNDSYSLAVIALKLKEIFELNDINELPIVYNIAWYEQKAVIVLLALLYLGVKNIKLGPTLPAFLSERTVQVLVDQFGISGISEPDADVKSMIG